MTQQVSPSVVAARALAGLRAKKQQHERIVALTAYDWLTATWLAQCPVDFLLVGDSLANVVAGHASTLPVTMDEMVYHTRMVVRGAGELPVVADMPFLSYEVTSEAAVLNAGRLVKEAGATAVKLEGGADMAPTIERIVRAHIPVLAHIGLTPQAVLELGGYKVQGTQAGDAERLRAHAQAVQDAGAFALVLECVPHALAATITTELAIPTIGIGAGPECDGQILVTHDLLGWFEPPKKFVRQYAQMRQTATAAVTAFAADVRAGRFPDTTHSF
jgi:3-methyl-2-oxobutanoate hydroxymethyltransferase